MAKIPQGAYSPSYEAGRRVARANGERSVQAVSVDLVQQSLVGDPKLLSGGVLIPFAFAQHGAQRRLYRLTRHK